MKTTNQDFAAAKSAARKTLKATGDTSAAHRAAMDVLAARRPAACLALVQDMGWQCVLAARN